ncbi:MAG: hypothetical protein ABI647_25570, partial [Gemmatimonadota bacterium]
MTWPVYAAAAVLAVGLLLWLGRRFLRHSAVQTRRRFRARLDRYKLVRQAIVRDELVADPVVLAAARAHAAEHGLSEPATMALVDRYIREIVPFFNI